MVPWTTPAPREEARSQEPEARMNGFATSTIDDTGSESVQRELAAVWKIAPGERAGVKAGLVGALQAELGVDGGAAGRRANMGDPAYQFGSAIAGRTNFVRWPGAFGSLSANRGLAGLDERGDGERAVRQAGTVFSRKFTVARGQPPVG